MKLLSGCCQAEVYPECLYEGASWFVCSECQEPCNVFNVMDKPTWFVTEFNNEEKDAKPNNIDADQS